MASATNNEKARHPHLLVVRVCSAPAQLCDNGKLLLNFLSLALAEVVPKGQTDIRTCDTHSLFYVQA